MNPIVRGKWTQAEDLKLKQTVDMIGAKDWRKVSKQAFNGSRSDVQCLHRWNKVIQIH